MDRPTTRGVYVPARRRKSSDGQGTLGEETLDTQQFFGSKKAAAVLKHEILKGYVPPFVGKTGSRSPGNRVVIMDGFAGAGRYSDGGAGSPAIFAEAARQTPSRNLECYFVEKDAGNYQALRAMLEQEGDAIKWEAWHGTAGAHMDEVLARANGLPLFMFIDPYGIGPDFAQVEDIFRRRPGGRGTPATEMLYRVDASALRRILGAYRKGTDYPAREGHIRRVDEVAGGSWWRDEDDGVRRGEVFLEWFFEQYLTRLCKAIDCAGWYADVKQKPHHQPAYYLVFLTRHVDGIELFGDTLSRALVHWRKTVFFEALEDQQRRTGQFMLDPNAQLDADERQLAASWHDAIEENVRALLRQHEQFVIRDHLTEVFGTTIGQAREMHVREALKRLHKAGITSTDSKGSPLYPRTVKRATDAQL
jgi:three-Cys-motif partner protein